MIDNKKTLKDTINADLFRYSGDSKKGSFIKAFFRIPGFRYSYFLRKCNYYRYRGLRVKYLFFRMFLEKYQFKYGFQIPYTCNIGKGFYLGHFGNVVINSETEIGCNVNIAQGVTIGVTRRGKNIGIPVIGNKVWVGANSIIVGKIRIGNNVLIAPGSYVNFDTPDNAVIMGNPGKIVSDKGTEGYINHTIE